MPAKLAPRILSHEIKVLSILPHCLKVLAYHIVPGVAILTSDIPPYYVLDSQVGGVNLTTAAKAQLNLYHVGVNVIAAGPEGQFAFVTKANIQAGAAIIHIIDR